MNRGRGTTSASNHDASYLSRTIVPETASVRERRSIAALFLVLISRSSGVKADASTTFANDIREAIGLARKGPLVEWYEKAMASLHQTANLYATRQEALEVIRRMKAGQLLQG